mgnify:CR=1 FL=1
MIEPGKTTLKICDALEGGRGEERSETGERSREDAYSPLANFLNQEARIVRDDRSGCSNRDTRFHLPRVARWIVS